MLCRSKLVKINLLLRIHRTAEQIYWSHEQDLSVKIIQEHDAASFRLLLDVCYPQAPSTFPMTKFVATAFANLVHCIDAAVRDKLRKNYNIASIRNFNIAVANDVRKIFFYFECGRLKDMHCNTCPIAS